MNAFNMARSAYAGTSAPIRTNRDTEYEVFARITRQMKKAAEAPGDFPRLAHALHENRRLWNIIAADVADDGNTLPPELRARIFYLAEFTAVHTGRILSGEGKVDVLIDINTAIMRGLGKKEAMA